MNGKIRIGITGYGNLGKGVEKSIQQNSDMELIAVFTRRSPEGISASVPVVSLNDVNPYQDQIDVMILCGGSATDLPEQGPAMAKLFTTVDSYDTHAKIPEYYATVDEAARSTGHISIISTGWDPGLFSLNRMLFEAILPKGEGYTFWGKGVSQGHSDAIRRIQGVKAGVQYTIPIEDALRRVRSGENPQLSTREKHLRDCYVVPEDGADLQQIEREIKEMPNYFADYETHVTFIDEAELRDKHAAMPHGGHVIRSGETGQGNKQIMEFSIQLGSNPEFTSSVLVAYARAAYKLQQRGETGARTVFDIAPGLLSPISPEQLRKELL